MQAKGAQLALCDTGGAAGEQVRGKKSGVGVGKGGAGRRRASRGQAWADWGWEVEGAAGTGMPSARCRALRP